MIRRLTIGEIRVGPELKRMLKTTPIRGYIEKIKVEYAHPHAEEAILQIYTEDMENLISIEGSKNGIWYPRNWDVQHQKYMGSNIAAEGSGAMSADRYVSDGPLYIMVQASSPDDYIKSIEIVIDGEIERPYINFFNKDEGGGMVSTNTPGVFNPSHRRRKKLLEKYVTKFMPEITKIKSEQDIITKASAEQELKEFIERVMYDSKFSGMSKSISDQIKDFILRAQVKGYDQERVMNYIKRKGGPTMTPSRATLIFRTESHALKTKVREWGYLKTDPEGTMKYKWIGPVDYRTTITCKRIVGRSEKGVSLNELNKIMDEEVELAKQREELPTDYEMRDYTPHFQCRHTFIRVTQ